ncbi:MAG: LysR family transcriptional regulator [Alteromonadaceae bacterium]|uniref:LysR family transcriptional regulator n=2 Tax=Paraglaciecola mesophila TaxID=197222 RepID=K6YRN5_9ALTE|nr:LysR family transcriptional regulator [Paraglaciecola mesophila]MAD14606.1 LysR family transcriptional regulator [Alteromonadaceae bacterium]MBB21199.1 LysR family transcriptional regulator [Rickettsiales bacterium]GAC26656.1 LysR family transcriptional regulator [Paraglaciecola mesophila KMM 241]
MNTKQLEYFLATVEQGSISGASKVLDVAQPAISLQLANLEHELKIKLFERNFRGVSLTHAGSQFEEHARLILNQINTAKLDLIGQQTKCKGKVIVGLSQSLCNVLSVQLQTELEHRFPNVELAFRVGPSYMVENWFAEQQIDIALCYNTDLSKHAASSLPLISENLYLYISPRPKNPSYSELSLFGSIPFESLQDYELFMPDRRDALPKLLEEQAQKSGIKLKTRNAFGQLMTTLHYVSQGFGLAIYPSSATCHLEASHQIRAINITEPELKREVYLRLAEHQHKNPAVAAVFELIRETAANLHADNSWRGELLDNKYQQPSVINIESAVAG